MICNKCGTQNNDNSRFCIGCGNSLQVMQQQVIPNVNNIQSSVVNNMQQPTVSNKPKKKINKKMLLIIIGALLAVAIVVLIFMLSGNKATNKELISVIDLEQPIPVYKDYKYVYIDTKGKIIKDIKYNRVNDFIGDYAFVELEDGTSALIDKNQNIKVTATSYYGMEYISEYDLWLIDGVLYNGNLKAITNKSINLSYDSKGFFIYHNSDYTEYGIVNKNGKKIYKNNCSITSLNIKDTNNEDEYYGILETTCYQNEERIEKEYLIELQTGKILYENKYKEQFPDSYYYDLQSSRDNIFYVRDENYNKIKHIYVKDNKIIYIIDEVLYDLELYGTDYLELDYGYDYDELQKEQRYFYYDIKNKKILLEEPKLDLKQVDIKIEKDITKRQIVSCSYGEGLIDNKKVIVPCIYDNVSELPLAVSEYLKVKESKDLVYIEDNNKTYIYNSNSEKNFITFEKSEDYEIYDYDNSLLIKQEIEVDYSKSKTIVYSLVTGKSIQFDANSNIEIKSNYFTESRNGKKIYYNMNFEKIYTES